jgi:hypothetical protein
VTAAQIFKMHMDVSYREFTRGTMEFRCLVDERIGVLGGILGFIIR